MTAADKIAEAPEPARYADTERNKIINRTSLDLRKIVHDFDPENDNLDIRVWDRLDQMAQEIEARAADLTDALEAEIAKSDALAQENAKLRGALERIARYDVPADEKLMNGKLCGHGRIMDENCHLCTATYARSALGDTP